MTTDQDVWYANGKDAQLTEVLANPVLQKALAMLMMDGVPHGRPGGDVSKEALEGAWSKGYFDFYLNLHRLATPKPEPVEPRRSRELVRDDLPPSVMPES